MASPTAPIPALQALAPASSSTPEKRKVSWGNAALGLGEVVGGLAVVAISAAVTSMRSCEPATDNFLGRWIVTPLNFSQPLTAESFIGARGAYGGAAFLLLGDGSRRVVNEIYNGYTTIKDGVSHLAKKAKEANSKYQWGMGAAFFSSCASTGAWLGNIVPFYSVPLAVPLAYAVGHAAADIYNDLKPVEEPKPKVRRTSTLNNSASAAQVFSAPTLHSQSSFNLNLPPAQTVAFANSANDSESSSEPVDTAVPPPRATYSLNRSRSSLPRAASHSHPAHLHRSRTTAGPYGRSTPEAIVEESSGAEFSEWTVGPNAVQGGFLDADTKKSGRLVVHLNGEDYQFKNVWAAWYAIQHPAKAKRFQKLNAGQAHSLYQQIADAPNQKFQENAEKIFKALLWMLLLSDKNARTELRDESNQNSGLPDALAAFASQNRCKTSLTIDASFFAKILKEIQTALKQKNKYDLDDWANYLNRLV